MGFPVNFGDSHHSFFTLSFATGTRKGSFNMPPTSGITIATAQDGTVNNSHRVIDCQLMVMLIPTVWFLLYVGWILSRRFHVSPHPAAGHGFDEHPLLHEHRRHPQRPRNDDEGDGETNLQTLSNQTRRGRLHIQISSNAGSSVIFLCFGIRVPSTFQILG
jgi:hypothetical protein